MLIKSSASSYFCVVDISLVVSLNGNRERAPAIRTIYNVINYNMIHQKKHIPFSNTLIISRE